jgi:adenine deaminase
MKEQIFSVKGQVVDVVNRRIFPGEVTIRSGRITEVKEIAKAPSKYIIPGLVDSHVHVESSMLVPSEFGRLASLHGTVATVSDPHEIANVVGMRGVEYMIENGKNVPFHFHFGAPSCVPATKYETAGAHLGPDDVEKLLQNPEILYLSEMMNYPGVLANDPEVMAKIAIAKKLKKPIDGHAPGLRGEDVANYIAAGITTDHECYNEGEALEKIGYGMKIIIREGSAAQNFDALIPIMGKHPEMLMFCSDDKHPDSLVKNHINDLVRRAIIYDFDKFDVLRAATYNPVKHYGLKNGLLQHGDSADFIIVDDLEDFEVLETYIKGIKVAAKGKTLLEPAHSGIINHFLRSYIHQEDLEVPASGHDINIIEVSDGQLITGRSTTSAKIQNGKVVADIERDLLKLVVVNRYKDTPPAIAFVHKFGLHGAAIASTVAHDSHNIIAVGSDDLMLKRAINLLVQNKGGISFVSDIDHEVLPLPVAGLMSTEEGYKVAEDYERITDMVKGAGCHLDAPFMSLSFLALLVIPELKLSDKGLFDAKKFEFTDLFVK